MPDAIPTRLLVISARVPEGEQCDGCDFASSVGRWVAETEKVEIHFCAIHKTDGKPTVTNGLRLPACRARDVWVAYPAESGVPELVDAAKAYAAASAAANEAKEEHGMGSSKVVPFINANTTARWTLQDAARKVAGEGER